LLLQWFGSWQYHLRNGTSSHGAVGDERRRTIICSCAVGCSEICESSKLIDHCAEGSFVFCQWVDAKRRRRLFKVLVTLTVHGGDTR
jgi:hypothetical protein